VVPLACAIAAILLWSSLATLSVSLSGVPPLFLIGVSLCLGGMLSLPWARHWTLRWKSVAIGCYGMLAYHLLFVLALRNAPPLSANLVHYTWPMLIVLLSPLFKPGSRIHAVHVLSAVCGFIGATLAIMGGTGSESIEWAWGYGAALAAALVWSTYSLAISRVGTTSTADVGLACLLSGGACLLLHTLFEPTVDLSKAQSLSLMSLGIGPMGAAFYLWAYALKRGDPRVIGVLANATPLLSTGMLTAAGLGSITATLIVAALLVSAASLLVVMAHAPAVRRRMTQPQTSVLP
jgi:drug/metabolite transporter (DMT)-like permease